MPRKQSPAVTIKHLEDANANLKARFGEAALKATALEIRLGDMEASRDEKAKLAKSFEELSLHSAVTADIERKRTAAKNEAVTQLKGELADAREEIARLNGYLQRVIEDNIVEELGPRHDAQPVCQPPSRRQPQAARRPDYGIGDSERRSGHKAWWSL